MKYITQMLYILLFSLLGEFLQTVIPLPIPAAIYGLVLLLLALCTGILKEEKVAEVSGFLISVMPILFVAPVAKLLQYWGIIGPNFFPGRGKTGRSRLEGSPFPRLKGEGALPFPTPLA